MTHKLLLLSIAIMALSGCGEEGQKPDCSLTICPVRFTTFNLLFFDKGAQKNLLFDSAAVYSASDLKIIPSGERILPPIILIDSINRIVTLRNVESGDQIQLGNLPPDAITLEFRNLNETCCGPYETSKLAIGDQTLCEPCKDPAGKIYVVEK